MDFKVLFSQLIVLYEKLTKEQKIIVASAIVGIVGFLIFMVVFSSKQTSDNRYEILFASISSEDAAKVIEQLEKDEVPYKIEDDNVIKVPKNIVYKERIILSSMGIPKNNGVGFELFDTQEFGATSFDQNVKYLRALEGELSRTLMALAPVASASVSLALPKETLFVSKTVDPSASVMVTTHDGERLSPKQIRGIKNLVASAVPKMKTSSVMLINSDGETLGDEDEMSQLSELSSAQQNFKNKEEKKRQKKIVKVISPFVGGDAKVVAQVTIDYDFSIKNSTSKVYDPENVVRSEQISEEKREGSTPKEVGGVPGTVSNIGPVQALKSNKTSQKYEKNTGTTNYEIGETVSTTKSQFARIKRVSAAVLVDGKYSYKLAEDGTTLQELSYKALDESDLEALTSLVARSIGINKDRGDEISVVNLQFKRNDLTVGSDEVSKIIELSEIYLAPFSGAFKYLFVLILLLIVYKKVISPFASTMLEVSKEEDSLERPVLDIDDDEEEDLVEKVQEMRKKVESQLGVGEGFNEDELKYEVLLEKVKDMTEDNPEDISKLIESLLIVEDEKGVK